MPNVWQIHSLKTRKGGGKDISIELRMRTCLWYQRRLDLYSPFQAAPGRRKLMQYGTCFFNLWFVMWTLNGEMSDIFGGLQYFNTFFWNPYFFYIPCCTSFIVKTGVWNLRVSIKESLVYCILNSMLTQKSWLFCLPGTCLPHPQPVFFTPLLPALVFPSSGPCTPLLSAFSGA